MVEMVFGLDGMKMGESGPNFHLKMVKNLASRRIGTIMGKKNFMGYMKKISLQINGHGGITMVLKCKREYTMIMVPLRVCTSLIHPCQNSQILENEHFF